MLWAEETHVPRPRGRRAGRTGQPGGHGGAAGAELAGRYVRTGPGTQVSDSEKDFIFTE